MEYTERQQQHIDKDGGFSVKHGPIHYGYKSHIKIDVDHHLIRDLEVTPANLHDGDVDLAEEGDQAVYRDKGYFGKQLTASGVTDKTMKRAVRGRKLNGREQGNRNGTKPLVVYGLLGNDHSVSSNECSKEIEH